MKYVVTINSQKFQVEVEKGKATLVESAAAPAPAVAQAAAPQPSAAAAPPAAMQGVKLLAPMPGVVIQTRVEPGDRVKRGQPLLVLEAMKMENEVVSPNDGVVAFLVAKGARVAAEDVLAIIG